MTLDALIAFTPEMFQAGLVVVAIFLVGYLVLTLIR